MQFQKKRKKGVMQMCFNYEGGNNVEDGNEHLCDFQLPENVLAYPRQAIQEVEEE